MTPTRTTRDAPGDSARRDDTDCTADDRTNRDRTADDNSDPTTMNRLAIDATADLEVQVPRGGDGTLQDGIVTVLDRSAAVDRTEVLDVSGVTPTLNDLRVDASVRLRVRVEETVEDERDAVREAVADQFGVRAVSGVETDRSA